MFFFFFFFFFNDTATTEIYTFPYTTLFRSRRASDDDRGRPRRRDQAHLRAALGHQRLRGGGFRGPPRGGEDQAAEGEDRIRDRRRPRRLALAWHRRHAR